MFRKFVGFIWLEGAERFLERQSAVYSVVYFGHGVLSCRKTQAILCAPLRSRAWHT